MPEPAIGAAPQVLGVDDFALRRGQVYGTVLVDIAAGKAIDLLPDGEDGTLETWLKAHPGAQVICRDRAGNYAEGARQAHRTQSRFADRWHLWHNLAEHAEKTVVAHRACLKDQDQDQDPDPGTPRASRSGRTRPRRRLPRRQLSRTGCAMCAAASGPW